MRTIGVVTVARSDYTAYRSLLRLICTDSELRLRLFVSGTHLSERHGLTVQQIERDGFEVGERVTLPFSSDTPDAIAKSIGAGVSGFAGAYMRVRPDILVVLGDRFEMHAAALAALPYKIPVAHIHGGEVTEGAFDDALRHSLTKLSHLHFVSTHEYADRVIQLGEEPWRVFVTGAPALDELQRVRLLAEDELAAEYGLHLQRPFLLVTFHPVTLEFEDTAEHCRELLAAIETTGLPALFTMPNGDTANRTVVHMIEAFVESHTSSRFVENLGPEAYFSTMALAAAMVGNSSSGLIEAASIPLPVVNIGSRQKGRVRGPNVIDVGYGRREISDGIARALDPAFRLGFGGAPNPYGSGRAAQDILKVLKHTPLDRRLTTKRFQDIPRATAVGQGLP